LYDFWVENMKVLSLKTQILIILFFSALCWSSSITEQFVGYDDIRLIVRNERIHKGPLETWDFYFNIVSDSHNVAWTNYPTVIYRPLEWFGSALGYQLWGSRGEYFHLFYNFSLHLLNAILIFFIIRRLFKKEDEDELRTSSFLPFIVSLIWAIHPLHNEAVNMLTSGVGFLSAMFLGFSFLLINLYIVKLDSIKNLSIIFFAAYLLFISFHGSEMAIIIPVFLLVIWAPKIFVKDLSKKIVEGKAGEFYKLAISASVLFFYFLHRTSIVSEYKAWLASSTSEFFERLLVLAPQILFHYIKLFFWPAKLSIDQHHLVHLENAGTLYHLLCLSACLFLVWIVFYWGLFGKSFYQKATAFSIFLALFGTAMSLNIIPLYVLARERYAYFLVLGLILAIALFIEQRFFHDKNEDWDLKDIKTWKSKHKILSLILLSIGLAFSLRSFIRNLDWKNGEKFWTSVVDQQNDIGTKQIWRYRLIEYYQDPGNKSFKANKVVQEKTLKDFLDFPYKYRLSEKLNEILSESKSKENYIKNKYGYLGPKSIASGLFFNANYLMKEKKYDEAIKLFQLAHYYYPEHFQTNLQLFINLCRGNTEQTNCYKLKDLLFNEARFNTFLGKGFMDAMFLIQDPQTLKYAKIFNERFPNTQLYNVYLFHASYKERDYKTAYEAAQFIVKKYHTEDIYDKFIQAYENRSIPNL
jgi:hypothetical protein